MLCVLQTNFYIASCSKAFLAASVGILMDDFLDGKNVTALPANVNEFNWATKVKDLLPGDFELMDPWASEKANVRDLLGHVSGIPRYAKPFTRVISAF
jgi:CubicO group peptidase (beta-lactamase class C family)